MKRLLILSMLALGGCDPVLWGGVPAKPMTPEQQRAHKTKRHCSDTAQLAQLCTRTQLEIERKAKGEWATFIGGFLQEEQVQNAHDVAYRECMMNYGYGPDAADAPEREIPAPITLRL